MKLFRYRILVIAILAGYGLNSCNEIISLPDLDGNLVGYVLTNDEFGNATDDKKDVLVSINGLPGSFSTKTDAGGRFEFIGLSAGTYELIFEKTGYGTLKYKEVKHLGGEPTIIGLNIYGNNWESFRLYQYPTTRISNLTIVNDTISGEFVFSGYKPFYLSLMMYLSDVPEFTIHEARRIIFRHLDNYTGEYRSPMNTADLPFQPGQTVYFRAAVFIAFEHAWYSNAISLVDDDTYYLHEFNRMLYPTFGDESDTFSYVVPE
jgi:hypothetical protein